MHAERLNAYEAAPAAMKALVAVETYIAQCGLEKSLVELVKMRASEINGCAYCLSVHSRDARKNGETEQRLYVLPAWRETSFYTPRERAALAWTEALTMLTDGVSDEVYEQARTEFSDKELTYLTSAIASINAWNRFGVAYRWTPPVRQAQVNAKAS